MAGGAPSVPAGRRLWDTRVIAIDDRTAVVTTLFDYPDRAVEGRQSQTWVRFADGWRVVAAHVSELQRATVAARRGRGAPHGPAAASRAGDARGPVLGGTRTAPVYRLVALPGPGVPRGGLVAVGAGGHAIEVELHELPTAGVGALLAALPAPLALGRMQLPEGEVMGVVCASAPAEAVDVSAWGSWPAYLAAVEVGAASG